MSNHIRFDWAMKRLLRQKANFDVLEGFLSELIGFDVSIKNILESEGNQENENDKFNQVDILVRNKNDDLILIEVQNERENDFFHRMNYGQAKLTTEYIDSGDDYETVKKVYSINIVYFDLGDGKDYVYKGLTEFRGIHKNDLLQLNTCQRKAYPIENISDVFATYYILKVKKFNDVAKNTLDEWVYFLKNSEIKASFQAKGLREAKEKLRVDNLSPEEKVAYDKFIKAKRIAENELATAKLDGEIAAEKKFLPIIEEERRQKEEALAKEKEKSIKFAKKMLKYGEPIEEIMEQTGLSRGEINNL